MDEIGSNSGVFKHSNFQLDVLLRFKHGTRALEGEAN